MALLRLLSIGKRTLYENEINKDIVIFSNGAVHNACSDKQLDTNEFWTSTERSYGLGIFIKVKPNLTAFGVVQFVDGECGPFLFLVVGNNNHGRLVT